MSTIKKTTSKPKPKPVAPAPKPAESKSKSATAVQQNKPTSSSSSSASKTASKPSSAAGKTENAQKPAGTAHSEIKTRDGLKLSDESRERESSPSTASSEKSAHRSDFVKRLRSAFFDNQSNALDPKDTAAHRGVAEADQKSDLVDDRKSSIFGSVSEPATSAKPPVSADAEDRRALRELTLERHKREKELAPDSVLANRAETAKLKALAESDADGKKSSGQDSDASLKSGELQSAINRLRDQDATKGVEKPKDSTEAKTKADPVKASGKEPQAKAGVSAKLDKTPNAEATGKAEPSGKVEASDATEKSKKADSAEKGTKLEAPEKTESTDKAKKAESPEKAEAADKTGKSEKSDKTEKTEKSDQAEKLQQTAVAQASATEAVGQKKTGKASGQSEKGAERFYDSSGPIGLKRPAKKSSTKALDSNSDSKTVAKAQANDSKTAAQAADRFYDSTGPIGLKRPAKKSATKALDSTSESKTVAKAPASESKTVAKAADRFYDSGGPIGLKRPTKRTAPKAAEPVAETAVIAKVSPSVVKSEEPRFSDAKTSRQESGTVQVVESQDRTPVKQPEAPKEEHKSGLFGALESLGDKAKEVAGGVVDKAKDIAGSAVDKAKETSGSVVDKTKEVLTTVVDKTKDVADIVVDKAKDGATGVVGAATAAAGVGKAVGSIFSQVGGVLAAAQAEKETPVKDVLVPTSQEYKDRAKSLEPALAKIEDPAKRAEVEKILAGNGRIDDSVLKSFGEKGSFDVIPDSDPRLKAGDETRQAVFNYDNGRISLAEGAFKQGALNNVVLEELGHFNDDRLLSNPATSEGWNKLTERGFKAEQGGRSINANSKSSEAEYASEIQAAYWKGPKNPDYWAAALAHPKDFKEVARIAGRGDLSEETSLMDGLRGTVAHLFGGRDITAHNQHRGDYHTDDELAERTSTVSTARRTPRFFGDSSLQNNEGATSPLAHNFGGTRPITNDGSTAPKPDSSGVKPDASTVKTDSSGVKQDTTTVKTDSSGVKQDTTTVKTDSSGVKQDTTTVKQADPAAAPAVALAKEPEPAVVPAAPQAKPAEPAASNGSNSSATPTNTSSNSTSNQTNYSNQNYYTQQSNYDSYQSQLSNLQQSQINGALDQIQGQLNAPGSAFQDLQRIDSMLQQSPQLQNAMGDLNQLASNLGSLKDLPQVAAHLEGLSDLSHSLAGIPDAVRGGQQVTELIQQVKDLPKGAKLEDHPQVASALKQLPKAVAELDKLPGLVKATQELPQHLDRLKALPEIVQGSAELAKDKHLMGNLKENLTTTAQVVAPAPKSKMADNDAAAKRPSEVSKDKLANPDKTPMAAVPSNSNAVAPKPLPKVAERVAELLKVDLPTTPQVNKPTPVDSQKTLEKHSPAVKVAAPKELLEQSVGVQAGKAKVSTPAAKTVSMGSKSVVNTTVRMQELPKMARDLSKVAQLAPETTVNLKSFLQVAQAPETQKTLQTLKSWATTPAGKEHPAQQGLDTLKSATQDPALKREVVRLENALKPIIGKESFARTVQHLENSLNTKAAIQEALPSLQAAARPEVREAANTLRAATLDRRTTTQLDRLHSGVQTIHEAKRASQSIVRQPQESKAPNPVSHEPVADLFEQLGKTVHESLANKRLEAKPEGFDVFVPRRLGAKNAPSTGTTEMTPAERPSKPALLLGSTRTKSPTPVQQPAAEHKVHHDHAAPVLAAPMVAEKHPKATPVMASASDHGTPVVTSTVKPAIGATSPAVSHPEMAKPVAAPTMAQVDKPISVGPSEAPVASASKSVGSAGAQQKQAETMVQQTMSAQLGMQAAPQVPVAQKAPVETGPIGNRDKSFKQSTQAVRSLTSGKGTNDQLWSLVYHSRTREGAKGLMDTLETTVVKGGPKQMQKLFDASTRNSDATLAFSSVLANLSQTQGDRLLGTVLLTTDGPGGQEAVQNLFSKMSQNQESSVRLGQFLENSSKTQPGVRGLNELIENWTQPAHDLDWSGANQLGSVLSGSSKTIVGSRAVGEMLKNIAAEEGGGQTIARTLNRMSRSKEGSQEATSLLHNLTFDQNGANETSKLLARASQSRDGARQVLDSFLNMAKTPSGVRNVGEVFNQLADSPQAANIWANFAKDTSNTGPLAELMEKMNSNPEASALLGQAFEKMADNPKNRGVWKVFEGRVDTSTLLTQEFDRAQENAAEASNYAKSSSAVTSVEESSSSGKSDRDAEQELPAKAAAAEASGQLSRAEAALAQRAVEAQNLQGVLRTELEGRLEESRHSTELYSAAETPTASSKTEETQLENKGSFRPGDYYSEETLKQAKICGQCGYRTTSLGFCPRCAVNNQDG